VVAVLGDLAALHDLNSLPLLSGLPVTLVIINNGGGGIFRFLNLPVEECLLETPHSWNFRHAAAQFGIEYHLVASRGELEARLCEGARGPRVLECPTDRESNHKLHTAIAAACLLLDLRWTK
jgi:2-succinyl-5-enolpyruvyl-6-hydroxy-3-cyclohexene-1-carboxylate synthase